MFHKHLGKYTMKQLADIANARAELHLLLRIQQILWRKANDGLLSCINDLQRLLFFLTKTKMRLVTGRSLSPSWITVTCTEFCPQPVLLLTLQQDILFQCRRISQQWLCMCGYLVYLMCLVIQSQNVLYFTITILYTQVYHTA